MSEGQTQDCPACHGRGQVGNEIPGEPCDRCGGFGYVAGGARTVQVFDVRDFGASPEASGEVNAAAIQAAVHAAADAAALSSERAPEVDRAE